MQKYSARSLAYTAIIAALYVALTLPLGSLATAPFIQVRPAEALTLLPALFPPASVGVTVGCVIVNLLTSSPLDALIGGGVTLVAAILTSKIKNPYLAALPPVLLNAAVLPWMFVLLGYETAYFTVLLQILLSQAIWVYALGLPLYFTMKKLLDKGAIKF